jgi:hypothetical protein
MAVLEKLQQLQEVQLLGQAAEALGGTQAMASEALAAAEATVATAQQILAEVLVEQAETAEAEDQEL